MLLAITAILVAANWCCDIMDNMGDASVIKRVKGEVLELCRNRPLYEFNQDL